MSNREGGVGKRAWTAWRRAFARARDMMAFGGHGTRTAGHSPTPCSTPTRIRSRIDRLKQIIDESMEFPQGGFVLRDMRVREMFHLLQHLSSSPSYGAKREMDLYYLLLHHHCTFARRRGRAYYFYHEDCVDAVHVQVERSIEVAVAGGDGTAELFKEWYRLYEEYSDAYHNMRLLYTLELERQESLPDTSKTASNVEYDAGPRTIRAFGRDVTQLAVRHLSLC